MNFEDFSAMTIEQLDSFLHENEEEAYEEEEEERDEECDEESGEPSLHEDTSADSGQDRMPSEFLNADNPLMAKFQVSIKKGVLFFLFSRIKKSNYITYLITTHLRFRWNFVDLGQAQ